LFVNVNSTMSIIILTCDGGSRSNPGPAASGFAIWKVPEKIYDPETLLELSQNHEPTFYGGSYLGTATNNQAEWKAVLFGLEEILNKYGSKAEVQVFLDSELVIRQISGQYKVKHPDLIPLHKHLKTLSIQFRSITFSHIFRKYNKKADEIVNQILDENA
jgi:ribonuclease HI